MTMRPKTRWILACLALALHATGVTAQEDGDLAARLGEMSRFEGYFDLYWDAREGRLYLQVDRVDEAFIYQSSMPRGVGSNDLGLDRGQLGATRMVEFQRSGPKVLLFENNLDFPFAAFLYSVSTFHCTPVSLAHWHVAD